MPHELLSALLMKFISPQNHERPQVNETLTVWGQLNLRNVINVGHSKMLIILIIINLITIIRKHKHQLSTYYQGGRLQDDDLPRSQPQVTSTVLEGIFSRLAEPLTNFQDFLE